MITEPASDALRPLCELELSADLVVAGGGLAGVYAAVQAAREGIKVILVQDRPVLGGNSSSEVRLWALGATSHMNNNNRWSREGGLVDELLVENTYRNVEGNPLMWDALLLEKVRLENNITLLLNTAVDAVEKDGPDRIAAVRAYCPQNETHYRLSAPLFCDASGDGVVGFQAGAAFRMGAEKPGEFGEGFAPDDSYGELLGHTIYFYTKDSGQPVKYVAPAFALKDITKIPRFKNINAHQTGCNFWWIEYGGRKDTIHETEDIKWELWSIVYGIWDYIKNSGKFPEADNLTLEWVGTIPGKRESRRFEGDYMLTQGDVIDQVHHADAVAVGGWSLDLHPSDGIYTDMAPCNQYHSKGVYGIPYRCYYSRNISNLFLAGRIISASHVAFGSTRVMLTCAHGGSAVGMAAAHCTNAKLLPRDLTDTDRMKALQAALNRAGQSIPNIPADPSDNLALKASISASSTLKLASIPPGEQWCNLARPVAQLVPWEPDYTPEISFQVRSKKEDTLIVSLRCSEKAFNYTPEVTVEERSLELKPGVQTVKMRFTQRVASSRYAFITFFGNEDIDLQTSDVVCTGLTSVHKKAHPKPTEDGHAGGEQIPPEGIGIDRFEFWVPMRRPEGRNLALNFEPALGAFADTAYLVNGYERPHLRSNAWIADLADPEPTLSLNWPEPQAISRIILCFDTDFDHAMETVQRGHAENIMPQCTRDIVIESGNGEAVAHIQENHQSRVTCDCPKLLTDSLRLRLKHPDCNTPASLFAIIID